MRGPSAPQGYSRSADSNRCAIRKLGSAAVRKLTSCVYGTVWARVPTGTRAAVPKCGSRWHSGTRPGPAPRYAQRQWAQPQRCGGAAESSAQRSARQTTSSRCGAARGLARAASGRAAGSGRCTLRHSAQSNTHHDTQQQRQENRLRRAAVSPEFAEVVSSGRSYAGRAAAPCSAHPKSATRTASATAINAQRATRNTTDSSSALPTGCNIDQAMLSYRSVALGRVCMLSYDCATAHLAACAAASRARGRCTSVSSPTQQPVTQMGRT